MNKGDNLLGILGSIYRWRKAIRNILLVTLVGSTIAVLLMKNYYKATTVFYPASPELASPELIFGYTSQVTPYFGSDRDLDRIAEIANSMEVVDAMVTKFHLFEHYGIDSTSQKGRFLVRETFRGLYSAQKNKNDAIELSVEDTDPQLAADVANAARNKINEIGQRLIKKSQATLLITFEDNMNRKKKELVVLADSLEKMQAHYRLYNSGSQGEQLSKQLGDAESEITRSKARLEVLDNNPLIPPDTIQYIKANVRAYEAERKKLLSDNVDGEHLTIKQYNEGLPKISVLADLHFQGRKQLTFDQERYNQIKSAYNTDIPAIQLLEAAEIPLAKNRPKRSVIVIAAVIAAFLFSVLGILLVEGYREIDWEKISQA
ncbi:MAG: hypothetical protein WCR52_16675 [Bacteroidota bacterium]